MKFSKILLLLFCSGLTAFGQEQQLDTLLIKSTKKEIANRIEAEEIQLYQAQDLGELLQKLPGVTTKNYGGLGGMKSVSIRGLGASQQQVVRDGFLIQNTQTGQVDLGTVYASNLERATLYSGGFSSDLLPVSALLAANILAIERKEAQFPIKKTALRAKFNYGSFQTLEGWISSQFKLNNKHLFSISAGRQATRGDYGYDFLNYSQSYKGKRSNADYRDWSLNGVYQWKINKSIRLMADYTFNQIDKGLPGAVILYFNSSMQRLNSQSHQANLGVNFDYQKWQGKFYASFKEEAINYLDNSYLNIQGFLSSNYYQKQFIGGWTMRNSWTKSLLQNFGVETNNSQLKGDISTNVQPIRWQLKGIYGLTLTQSWGEITGQIAAQTLQDFSGNEQLGKLKFFAQPAISYQLKKDLPVVGNIHVFYKKSVRVPSFNELYYNQVGNVNLLPEIAHQLQLSFNKEYKFSRARIDYGGNGYFNQERNKIVAIPTKNLFVWMIQNVGTVQIAGTDVYYRWSHFLKNWKLSTTLNYTFQSVTDRTNRSSNTFGDQLAYFPKHIGNVDFHLSWKKSGLAVNTYFVGKRFALNENIESNLVGGYVTVDVQIYKHFKIKEHQLTLRLMGKNLGNLTYAYVKYYVMPKAHFLISLNYEF